MTEEERIRQLRKELHEHNYNYYVLNAPTIDDREFDMQMHELQDLESRHPELYDANSPTQRVGSDLNNEFETVLHKRPMLSLANTYNKQEVAEFYSHVEEGLQGMPFQICCELKFDGLSISLHYEKGKLTRAVTRGDGVRGDDVTSNVRTIKTIPLQLPEGLDYPDEFEIRGEILMPWETFDRINREREEAEEPLFANPRNAASGTLKSKNSSTVAKRGLDAYLYYLLGDGIPGDGHFQNLQAAQRWGFHVSNAMRLVDNLQGIYDFIDYWDTGRKNLPVATDGIVLKVNSLGQQKSLGMTAKSPRWAIAYKFQAEQAETILRQVVYQVGRTGSITPVANMDTVQLSGTQVKRATLHNADIIEALDLHIEDHVIIEKGGEIIPKIVAVNNEARLETEPRGEKVEFISTCPVCGSALTRYEGEAAHYCTNENACPPQILGRLEHFVSRKAMNITSFGTETMELFFENGLINSPADLYELTEEQLMQQENAGKDSVQKMLQGIAESKQVPFERVLFAIGIRFVGEIAAKILAHHYKNIDAVANATLEDMQEINGIGNVIALSVTQYFRNPENMRFIERLRAHGLQMQLSETEISQHTDLLAGKSIVISGVFVHHSRDEYKSIIEKHSGKNVGSISAKTSFVLAGSNMGPAKLEKANKLNIPIVNEDEFLEMITHPQISSSHTEE